MGELDSGFACDPSDLPRLPKSIGQTVPRC